MTIICALILAIASLLAQSEMANTVGSYPANWKAHVASAGQVGTVLLAGGANFAEPSHGPNYLAMRLPRGTWVRICGVTCRTMTVNDYGPKNRAKVADIALVRFTAICGFASQEAARRAGICPVEVEVLGKLPPLPATDAAPDTEE